MARFLCDAMLGSLARWLRLAGFDCEFSTAEDAELARRAEAEGRWLLTRDRELAAAGPRTVMVRSATVEEQLVEVLGRLGLEPAADLGGSRCAACNGVLARAERSEVAARVPPHVLATAERFRQCLSCGRVYWPGSHAPRILRRLERVRESLRG